MHFTILPEKKNNSTSSKESKQYLTIDFSNENKACILIILFYSVQYLNAFYGTSRICSIRR